MSELKVEDSKLPEIEPVFTKKEKHVMTEKRAQALEKARAARRMKIEQRKMDAKKIDKILGGKTPEEVLQEMETKAVEKQRSHRQPPIPAVLEDPVKHITGFESRKKVYANEEPPSLVEPQPDRRTVQGKDAVHFNEGNLLPQPEPLSGFRAFFGKNKVRF